MTGLDHELATISPLRGAGCTIVDMRAFSFRYRDAGPWVLKDITLSIAGGELVFIGGSSGSGKSTLCAAMSGQIPFKIEGQMKGNVSLFSRDAWSWDPVSLAGKVGHVFQNAEEQLVSFTVHEEIAFAVENMCLSKDKINERVDHVASLLGITALLRRPVMSLSGGEKQKVIIAANLVMRPSMLIFDEPLAFLDAEGERVFLEILEQLRNTDPSLAIIIVEHRLAPFRTMVDKMLVLGGDGSLAFTGCVDEYLARVAPGKSSVVRIEYDPSSLARLPGAGERDATPLDPVLVLEQVSFRYPGGPFVLKELDFHVERGEVLGIVGSNGSGKTTLLQVMAGILEPLEGTVTFDQTRLDGASHPRVIPRIGFIFQNPEHQLFEGTVREEILYGPRNLLEGYTMMTGDERDAIVREHVELVNEERVPGDVLAEKNPFKLSWGQKRRLNIGSVLSYGADVLMLDEPFIGQDVDSVRRIVDIIHKFHHAGKTTVLVSHDLDILRATCTRVVVMPSRDTTRDTSSPGTVPESEVSRHPARGKKKGRKRRMLDEFLETTFKSSMDASLKPRFNPVSKLVAVAAFTMSLFFQQSLIALMLAYCFTFLLACSYEKNVFTLLRKIKWVVLLVVISVPLNALFDATAHQGEVVLFYILPPFFPVRRFALYVTLRAGFTILTMFTASVMFVRTTPVKHIVHGFIGAGMPYRHAFSLMVGLRYIPLVRNESVMIEVAQQMRGVSLGKRSGVKGTFNHLVQRTSTLLVSLFRKIDTTAMSMDARAFGAFPTRTSLISIPVTLKDGVVIALAVVLAVTGILYGLGAFPGLVPPSLYSMLVARP